MAILHSSNFFPIKGRIVPELRDEGIIHYREIILSTWRIIYRVGYDTVYIIAIIENSINLFIIDIINILPEEMIEKYVKDV